MWNPVPLVGLGCGVALSVWLLIARSHLSWARVLLGVGLAPIVLVLVVLSPLGVPLVPLTELAEGRRSLEWLVPSVVYGFSLFVGLLLSDFLFHIWSRRRT
jgi:hypothetical protein